MRYGSVVPARFLARPNRFIALVDLDGRQEAVHVKNTGRCRELLVPGAPVYLEKGTNPGRKTAYDLIAVQKGQRLINMDAQAPNRVFAGGALPRMRRISGRSTATAVPGWISAWRRPTVPTWWR